MNKKVIPVATRWGSQPMGGESYYLWESPTVRVWFGQQKKRLAIGFEYLEDLSEQLPELSDNLAVIPEDIDWHYCILDKKATAIAILPVVADKPILFNLETPVLMHPGASISVYIELRTWLCFTDSSHLGKVIYEIPTVALQKAWFGNSTTDGKVCYWRKEKAMFSPVETSNHPHIAVCPVTIYNRSKSPMNLDRIYLPTSRLSVFDTEQGLVTDRVQVSYTGCTEVSSVRVSGMAPPYAKSPVLLSRPRESTGTVQSVVAGAVNLFSKFNELGDDD